MVSAKDIGWGGYREWEGPFFRGHKKYALPAQPDFLDKCLYVITSTEGGAFDAVNMYDRCILSVGLIQWCERNFSFSAILARCATVDQFMLDNALKSFPGGIRFKESNAGVWRFFSGETEIDTEPLQRTIFLGAPHVGKKGTWTPQYKQHAKEVAACMANIWDLPLFRVVQAEATKAKLMGFVLPQAQKLLFADKKGDLNFSWGGATRAMYLSFAANNPTIANNAIQKAAQHANWLGGHWHLGQFVVAAQHLTFGPQIDIYPERYDAIAPVLQKVFGVDIPQTAEELKNWDDFDEDAFKVEVSEEDKQVAARLAKLSDDLAHGRGEGLDALDALMKEHPNDDVDDPGGVA